MLNQTVLVGRLSSDLEVKELENGKKVTNMVLAVPRSYKNEEGVYETDFIDCELWNSVADNTAEYCKKGDLVGVKGRIKTDTYEVDGKKTKKTSIVGEKVTFLSSKKIDEKTSDDENDKSEIDI